VTVTTDTRPISLETHCACNSGEAAQLAGQLGSGRYDRCSVLTVPDTIDEWLADHGTARKRVQRAHQRGYRFARLDREHHADAIHAINTSASHRQGRPMSAGYLERQEFSPLPDYPCARHQTRVWGVFDAAGVPVAYLVMIRSGQLALVSQILGHADRLHDEVMWLLFAGALEAEIPQGGFVVYNRHDSGTDGLRWWKERCGFQEEQVEWRP
jgi:hypothetical protein